MADPRIESFNDVEISETNPEKKPEEIMMDFEKGADQEINRKVAEMEEKGKSQEVIDSFVEMAVQAKNKIIEAINIAGERGLLKPGDELFVAGMFVAGIGVLIAIVGSFFDNQEAMDFAGNLVAGGTLSSLAGSLVSIRNNGGKRRAG